MGNKKHKFISPYIGIETENNIPLFYNRKGDYSAIFKIVNPVKQYSADMDNYYDYHALMVNVFKVLGAGYTVQKQDILSKRKFVSPNINDDYLSSKYFEHFDGRIYTNITTYLVITGQLGKTSFFSFDRKAFDLFLRNIEKLHGLFDGKGLSASLLSEKEIEIYIRRFFSINFDRDSVSLDNISARETSLKIGKKNVQNISIVDIDEVDFPTEIKPYKEINLGTRFPVDLVSFLHNIPNVDTVIYNQVITIPNQKLELAKLEAKKKKHSSMPDPANDLCKEDIEQVQNDIAKEGQMLVYSHFNIIVCGEGDVSKASNYIEGALFDNGITISKQCFNQLELFEMALPGNATNLKNYDSFLTTSDAAACLIFKESLQVTEVSPFLTYFTDRQGLPVGIDLSGKEGEVKMTNNSNFFVLGPSGSGKSFYVNSKVRQWTLENTDIVLVDVGHSYSGLCSYYGGKYITYSEQKPISMNPFRITRDEYNVEKRNFIKSLIFLIWKGTEGIVNKEEEQIMDMVLEKYYSFYFSPFTCYSDIERENLRESLLFELRAKGSLASAEDVSLEVDKLILKKEAILKKMKVKSLSFNTFFEFSLQMIPIICNDNAINFEMANYRFLLKPFYKGGALEKTLNEDFDNSLFEEKFIVFEIDAIKDDPILFPIVTLIIMDVFIQKMRLKKNRKALIIEEAWKAIASPMMAGYILYLYKTVRKFWGMCMVVTQELDDIISNPVVKNSIINNSDIICLLDQAKFKDKYDDVANLLSLNEVHQRQIFTINQLQNKENRNRFNEVFIKRGNIGGVYGVEVSLHEYFCFTTERSEKDALALYISVFGDFNTALDSFVSDLKKSKMKTYNWVAKVNKTALNYSVESISSELVNYNNELGLFILDNSLN